MGAPRAVLDLVERFDVHREVYTARAYNETQVRREFIDPLFEAMGWDIHNRQGFAEQFKQVVHEDSIRIGGVAKAPDYSFRLGGRRIFFLEAKKPAVNLKEDPSPAYQLRRYAWTAKLPVSILTDFEEFIVYDTRVKPVLGDKASTARVLYVPYAEYGERWEEMAALFSPGAIQKGALDKYVTSATKKRGTAEVDDAFLAEIEEWRDLLARNVALRNPGISQRELNYAVQTTIDRIVFLRICEDRAIEPYAQLMALQNGGDVYARLRVLYERADERYNSGLFHFHKERDRTGAPDTLTPGLEIDDKVLKAIIKRLYYPESPYEFSVLPAEILGQVYERFLGSVIRLTPGGQAKVEQKPEVRKAGGVYYTPGYIVDYIVKHTVGKLLEGKTPQEVAGVTESWRPSKTGRPLAILDPACGSGSFLLGAYQYLLDWHLEYYSKDTGKWSTGKEPRIYQDHRGVWRLVTAERKRILLANIYGVDIDAQAVEVTKLSLLLRVLEGENADTLQKQFTLFHERALPDLANNIKCGNSLIGPDFYQGRQTDFDEEENYRVNAFDWNAEFPQVMGRKSQTDKGVDNGLQPIVSRRADTGSQPLASGCIDNGLQPIVNESSDVWFVTFVTYCSRVSERMVQFGVTDSEGKGLQPLVFTADEQVAVAETLFEVARRHEFAFIALNVLPDHVHAVLPAPDEKTLTERVRMLKVFSAQVVNRRRNAEKGAHVWAQKFNRSRIDSEDALNQICKYVCENHLKHQERWGARIIETWDKGLQPLVQRECKFPTAWDNATADQDMGMHTRASAPSNTGLQTPASAHSDKGLQPLVHPEHEHSPAPSERTGGFDVVIGNPPYVDIKGLPRSDVDYVFSHFKFASNRINLFAAFIERGFDLVRKSDFAFSMIVPTALLAQDSYKNLRCWISSSQHIDSLVRLPNESFGARAGNVKVDTVIFVFSPKTTSSIETAIIGYAGYERVTRIDPADAFVKGSVDQERWSRAADCVWSLDLNATQDALLRKCETGSIPLDEYAEFCLGLTPYDKYKGHTDDQIRNRVFHADSKKNETFRKLLAGNDVRRYSVEWNGRTWISYGPWLGACRERRFFTERRILVKQIIDWTDKRIWATIADEELYNAQNAFNLIASSDCSLDFLLGILNSKLMSFYHQKRFLDEFKMRFQKILIKDCKRFPIRDLDLHRQDHRARHDKIVSLVQRMLDLHRRLQAANTEHERGVMQRQIAATDNEIDRVVYELYELADDEIAIVENDLRK